MKNNTIKIETKEEDVGNRLDVILSKRVVNLTRSNLKKIIELRQVKINGDIISSPARKIKSKDFISIDFIINNNDKIKSSNIKLDILFEDKDLIVLNKKQVWSFILEQEIMKTL